MAQTNDQDKGVKQCPAGTILFREGEDGDRLYVIKSGLVRLTKRSMQKEILVEELGAGEFCGELSLVTSQPRTVTAVVAEDAALIQIDASQFEQMVRSNSDISLRMLKKMSQRLTHTHWRISTLSFRTTMARLVHQLRSEALRSGRDMVSLTALPDNLAELLDLELGELKRLLGQLVRDELISIDARGYFQILDPMQLERYLTYLELQDRFEFTGVSARRGAGA